MQTLEHYTNCTVRERLADHPCIIENLVAQAFRDMVRSSSPGIVTYLLLFSLSLYVAPLRHDVPGIAFGLAVLMLLTTVCRAALCLVVLKAARNRAGKYAPFFVAGAYCTGAVWSTYCLTMCCFYGTSFHSLLLIAVSALIAIGSTRTLGPNLTVAARYAMLLLVPFVVWSAMYGDGHALTAGALIVLYIPFVLLELYRFNREYWESRTNSALLQIKAKELEETKNFIENVFDTAGSGLCVTDAEGHVIKTNRALEKMLGYGHGEIIGKRGIDFSMADASETTFARIENGLDSELFFEDYETIWRRKDGSSMPCAISTTVLTDPTGDFAGIVTSVRDITQQKKAEDALRESEEKLRSFIMESLDGISLYDEDARATVWNHGMEVITGLTAKEVMNRHYWDIAFQLVPDEKKSPELQEIIKAGYSMYTESEEDYRMMHEFPMQRPDGTRRDVQSFPFLIRTAGTPFFGLICRDITERTHAAAEREKLVAELQAALENVNTLKGLLPICTSCKKIRDDQGYWNNLEGYIQRHSDAEFSHSLCPECARRMYPEYFTDEEEKDS